MAKKVENNDEGMSTQNKVLLGAGLAAIAAAAAGAIFLYGTEAGKKKRKQIASWMLKMQADVLDRMESMKEWSQEAYNAVVDSVAENYKTLKGVDTAQLALLVADLKKHWNAIRRQAEGGGQTKKRKTTKKAKKTK